MALDRFQMRTKIRKRERTPRRVYAVDPVFVVSLQNVEFIVLDSLSLLNWEKKTPKYTEELSRKSPGKSMRKGCRFHA